MKTRFLLLLLLLACSPAKKGDSDVNAQEPKPESVTLKVMSYNLRFGELASLEQLAEFIKSQNPDVVALQECDCRTNRELTPQQNGKDFVTELGFRTGMMCAYGKTIPYKGGYYGIGILSRYPLARVERVYLPPSREQRALLVADVEYAEGKYFTFASTHLDVTGTDDRQRQVAKINELLTACPYPVIVAGDFNAQPDAAEIAQGMMTAWMPVCKMQPTSPASSPRNQIDYIFCYPKDKWTAVSAETYDVQLSDHLPISATVNLND